MAHGEISEKQIREMLERENLDDLTYEDIVRSVTEDPLGISKCTPEGYFQIDPRSGLRVVYTPGRATRPHDHGRIDEIVETREKNCPVCHGGTTGIIDLAELSDGFTFINKNLYPVVYYHDHPALRETRPWDSTTWEPVSGGHFLQWTHSRHDRDFHNMDASDAAVVLSRLAAFEGKMLHNAPEAMPVTWSDAAGGHRGHVGIIKNFGYLVGGSLAHGHQQMIHSNVLPRRIEEDAVFSEHYGKGIPGFMLERNPENLLVKDYGTVAAVVPYFMKRPLDSFIIVKDTSKSFLHDLEDAEIRAMASAVCDVTRAIGEIMPDMGRLFTYNMLVHNGAPGGLYVEFLPYTQETGGYENLGIYICHELPEDSAKKYREKIRA